MNRSIPTLRALFVSALPYFACLVPLAIYQILYVNAFYPITEGWFSEYAHLIRTGAVPYRDFSLLLTPLYPVKSPPSKHSLAKVSSHCTCWVSA